MTSTGFVRSAFRQTRSLRSCIGKNAINFSPDSAFADLFQERGRRSVPPSVVATVMVLQRLEGLSDREAVERYMFDARWRYACGVGRFDGAGWPSFVHTVLVGHAGAAAPIGAAEPGSLKKSAMPPSKRGWLGESECLTQRPCMTRWQLWIRSRSSATPSARPLTRSLGGLGG